MPVLRRVLKSLIRKKGLVSLRILFFRYSSKSFAKCQTKKFVREQAKLSNKQRLTLLDMTVRKAQYRKDNHFSIQHPNKIIPVIINEEYQGLMVAGSENVTIDLDKMTKNSERRKKSDVYR